MSDRVDASLPNRHVLIAGCSGSGKSSYLRALLAADPPARLVAWDPDHDHDMPRRERVGDYVRELARAVRSGRRYRLALTCRPTVAAFERWCQAVWAIADARRPITAVVEELSDVSPGAGRASPAFGELVRKGRKYGVRILAVTQSPAEISKTIYRNVGAKVALRQEGEAERRRMAEVLDVPLTTVLALQPLEYLARTGAEPAARGSIAFRGGRPAIQSKALEPA